MTVERLLLNSREEWLAARKPTVGASAAAALLGVHPFLTAFGLWADKTGRLPPEGGEESPPLRRGRLLEPVALKLLGEERPHWLITANTIPGGQMFVDRGARLSATPDAFATDPGRPGFGLVEVKTVEAGEFRRKWRDEEGEVAPPLWVSVQAIVGAHLTGASWAVVAALVASYGLDLHVVDVPIHAGVIERVRAETAAFWRLVDSGKVPDADYGRDADLIRRIFAEDDGEVIDLRTDNRLAELIAEREARKADQKSADADLKEINAEIIAKLGTASAAETAEGLLSARTVHRKEFTVAAGSYRRITFKPHKDATA